MFKIQTNDKVQVMRGKEAGKSGEVLQVLQTQNKRGKDVVKVVVRGINKVKKHQKPNPTLNLPGGIIEIEKPIDISNVMIIDPSTNTPTRIGIKVDPKTGKKVRFAKKSGTVIK